MGRISGVRRALHWRMMLGAVAGFLAVLLAGEAFLRLSSPDDLRPYLGRQLALTGPYVADPATGADYRTFDLFADGYRERLDALARDNAGRPVWMLFGNSFTQAPGMLGDTAQAAVSAIQFFYLQRNEPLYLRVAQFRQLVANGHRPDRVIFVVLPIDLLGIALDPVAGIEVTSGGALGKVTRKPPFLAPLLDRSRLALAAWTRGGRNTLLPGFKSRHVLDPLPDLLPQELDRLFGEIARVAHASGIEGAIVFIPNKEQLFGDPRRTPQDAFSSAAARAGLDFIDTTADFLAESDKPDLLIPDGHLSDRGNAVLLDALRKRLPELETGTSAS